MIAGFALSLGLEFLQRWWRAIAIVVFLASTWAWHIHEVHKAHEAGRAEVQTKWDADRAEQRAAAAKAKQEEAGRRLAAAKENQRDLERDAAARLAADAAADRLRERIAALARGSQAGPAQPGGAPARAPADLLADVQRRIDEAAGVLARVADDRRSAGLQCEREHDATQ